MSGGIGGSGIRRWALLVLAGYLMRVLVPEDKCSNTKGRREMLVTIVLAMIVLVVTIKATWYDSRNPTEVGVALIGTGTADQLHHHI